MAFTATKADGSLRRQIGVPAAAVQGEYGTQRRRWQGDWAFEAVGVAIVHESNNMTIQSGGSSCLCGREIFMQGDANSQLNSVVMRGTRRLVWAKSVMSCPWTSGSGCDSPPSYDCEQTRFEGATWLLPSGDILFALICGFASLVQRSSGSRALSSQADQSVTRFLRPSRAREAETEILPMGAQFAGGGETMQTFSKKIAGTSASLRWKTIMWSSNPFDAPPWEVDGAC